MNYPEGLKYTKSDEWVRVEGNDATLGVSDYAQDQLSDIVFLEVNVGDGDVVAKGDVIAVVESVKAASDIYSPLSGTIKAVNDPLADTPELINSDPYGEAWILTLELSEPGELSEMMETTAYMAYIQEREG